MIDIRQGSKTRKRVIANLIANSCLKDAQQMIKRGEKNGWCKKTIDELHNYVDRMTKQRDGAL